MFHSDFFTCTYSFLFLYLSSFLFGITGAYLAANFAQDLGLVDYPIERSSHDLPIPKGGGVGILAAFILSSLFLKIPLAFWLSATLLSLLSLLGDFVEIKPRIRLLFQFISAVVLLLGIFDFDQNQPLTICKYSLMVVFLVGTANFYNFMDGVNGIAGITGMVGFGFLSFYAYSESPNHLISVLAACISLSCLGFLPFNLPKAKVFMGDVGSILLGFVFAASVAMLSKSILDFICLAAFLFPFYADGLITIVARLRDKERLTKAHRRHLYQLLANELNVSHWKVSMAYGAFQVLVGAIALIVKPHGVASVLMVLGFLFCGFALLSLNIRRKVGDL